MLITNLADFVKSIPTAKGTNWDAIEPFITSADAEIQTTLTGADLYNYIVALTGNDMIKNRLKEIIAFTAYRNAIPFVDLIQTANGFGVVSNSNQAPASKERVERLLAMCEKMIDSSTDLFIISTLETSAALTEWTKFSGFLDLTNNVFVTGIEFAKYFKQTDLKRKTYLDYKIEILNITNIFAKQYGQPVIDEVIDDIRKNDVTDTGLTKRLRFIIGKSVGEKFDADIAAKNGSFTMIYEGLKDKPSYKDSNEAALIELKQMGSGVANKKEDPTFFFGM